LTDEPVAHIAPVDLADLLDQAAECSDWRVRLDFLSPFIEAMVQVRLLLSERDVLIERAASVFGCYPSSLLIDMKRARLEVARLEDWYRQP
jgi:hypothetical protein